MTDDEGLRQNVTSVEQLIQQIKNYMSEGSCNGLRNRTVFSCFMKVIAIIAPLVITVVQLVLLHKTSKLEANYSEDKVLRSHLQIKKTTTALREYKPLLWLASG